MLIVRNAVFTSADATVTGLKRTDDMIAGLYLYGTKIDSETTVLSVTNGTTIEMSKPALASGASSVQITSANSGTYIERCGAMNDVATYLKERGDLIEFMIRSETDITRDSYNSMEKRADTTKLFFYTYPVQYSPTGKILEKAGIRENCDVIVWTSMLDWINAGYGFSDIDLVKCTVRMQGQVYECRDKSMQSQFNDSFLYMVFGLNKR